MRLVADSGLWRIGPAVAAVPLVAVLEVDGAVLAWTVDESVDASGAQITLTDAARADWLWRVLGEDGHQALAAATAVAPDHEAAVDLSGIELRPGAVDGLRRLAVGHWLRRWWPASVRDGILGLDPALLDAEIALLTSDAEDFVGEDSLDADIGALLAPHAGALAMHLLVGDPRVVELVRKSVRLAEDIGVDAPGWADLSDAVDNLQLQPAAVHQDDYALAAGRDTGPAPPGLIARGAASIAWSGVPGGVFDAAEDTVGWAVAADGDAATATLHTAVIGPGSPAGVPVALRCGDITGVGVLDASGRATIPLLDRSNAALTAAGGWDQDWSATAVTVGAEVAETADARERVRRFARRRLALPGPDAFLAETLAAESDY
ncbi:hypothetical protein [Mycolicibacterium aichiense]|uniref:Uncharacterized protein n=1 Tax=Mycolicibacterium aichiense TaxID=1799 RepID=A0AAD1HMW1_9MYCO|nr:hypothetical protein [Mycolicibacterium aichiense]MCV7020508.1 hypothetical protein [Mycolicibacterium aichiense]BBX08021.1 hypothetical protein MAIC_28240 [Mycolicibacterium aichiense]STZ81830.1 Uncharacterised protein [Mycolicibacterium aichiense]